MKRAWSFPSRILVCLFVVGSIFAYVETAYDSRFYSDSFLTDANRNISSEDLEISEPMGAEEGLAQLNNKEVTEKENNKAYKPKIQFVGMNKSSIVDGNWEVVAHSTLAGEVFFDRENIEEDKDAEFNIELKLIEASLVMVDNLEKNLFNISILTEMGTVVLFRPLGDSFEVIQARKLKKSNKKVQEVAEVEEVEEEVKGFHVDDKTCFLKAHDPKGGNKILMGDSIEGSITVYNDEIHLEGISLSHIDPKGKEKVRSLNFSGMIQENGTIFQDDIGGHVSIIGKKEIRIMFAQGPLAQATLTFGIADRCDAAQAQLNPEREQEFEEMMSERNQINDENGDRLNPADSLEEIEEPAEEELEEEFAGEEFEEEYDEEFDEEIAEEELEEEEEVEVTQVKKITEKIAFNF